MKTEKHILVLDSRIKWEENIQTKEIVYVTFHKKYENRKTRFCFGFSY